MKIPNPFKNFRHKSKDIHDLVKRAEVPPPPVKISGPLRWMSRRRGDVAALMKKFEDIRQVRDPGERLIQYKGLQESCGRMLEKITGKTVLPAVGTGAGGVFLTLTALAILDPLLLVGGLVTTGAGLGMLGKGSSKPRKWTLSPALSKDCDALADIITKTNGAMEDIVVGEPLLNIAQSPYFNEATASFPALKDRFLLSAAKEKIIHESRPSKNPDGPER